MKKLIILLIIVAAIGTAAAFMLGSHSDMQVQLPTSYTETTVNTTEPEVQQTSADMAVTGNAVSFSPAKAFHDNDIDIELKCPDENAVIYYTTDGNDPTTDSKRYTEPIHITAKNRETAATIKAIAFSGDERSDIAVKSYIVGKNVSERFTDDTLVFVLSSDEYNLYDYYYGIATEGYLRDEYMKNEYKGGEIIPTDPANFNMRGRESERPMYVEVFDSTGDRLISQAAGARVVGGYSRAVDQKSWRLFARNIYSEGNGKFKYPFFPGDRDSSGNFITRYDRITLRNGANDREFAGLRDELTMTLASEAGFPDTQAVRPAAVFLNGEYYGFSWLHEAYSDDYLEMMYGGNNDNFRIVGSEELSVESDDPEDENAVADWNKVVALAEKDLTVDLYFNEFCDLVDIDDLMLYYAMQVYIDNKDWPGNNFKVWRYYPSDGEEVTSEYLDGKWRFLLFDAEYAWGLYGAGYADDTLRAVITGKHMKGASHILGGLLQRADMREKFANTICELQEGVFSPENVKEKLDKLIAESDSEQMYALKNGYQSTWASEWSFADSRQQIRDFAEYRSSIMNKSMINMFGYSGTKYRVNFRTPTGTAVMAGSHKLKSGEGFSVGYYTENSVTFRALPYDGYAVDHWEVNGVRFDGDSITISSANADANSIAEVSLFLSKTGTNSSIYVSELYTSGDGDWIEFYNPSESPVNIKGYHLSDDKNELDKYEIPDMEIAPGSAAVIVCKNNRETSALMRHQTNFSLKTGETLYFTDSDLNIISSVPVLGISPDKSLSRGADGLYNIGVVTEDKHYE